MLDPVFVEANSGNPWLCLSGPGFEIISHCPAGFNEAYARALQKAAAARLAYRVATLHARLGEPDRASAIIECAMSFSESEQARRLLSAFPAAQGGQAR